MQDPENQVQPAWKTLYEEYKAGDAPFHMVTRPYYSCGGFKFTVEKELTPANQLKRAVLVAEPQAIELFSYSLNQNVRGVQLGNREATLADTNLSEASETNDEDFAITGLSCWSRGVRVKYSQGANTPFNSGERGYEAVHEGTVHIVDPGAHAVAPEIGSPLVLEDVLLRLLQPRVSMRTLWNRKEGDYLGLLRLLPVGGAESYLHANGEPRADNYFKLSEGYKWRREGSTKDSKFMLRLELEEPIVCIVTDPNVLTDNQLTEDMGVLTEVHYDLGISLHGFAFYYASDNN